MYFIEIDKTNSKNKHTIKLIKTMRFYLTFMIFVIFLLGSLGNDHPIKNGKLQERNQVIQTLINDM